MAASSDDPRELLKGHRERLREKLKTDPLSMADYEVLELVLGLAIARQDTKLLAKELLAKFGGLRGALDARQEDLLQVKGFGPALQSLWRLIREVMARHASAPLLKRQVLASSESVAAMARQRLANKANEELWLALVDAQNHMLNWSRLRQGGISFIAVEPRDVLTPALTGKASGIILVHNHPGGSPYPSSADLSLTQELQNLAPKLGLRFLDHLIITSGDCYSILQKKLFQNL